LIVLFASVCAEELADHRLVGWLDVLGFVLITVHDEGHADSEHEHFAVSNMLRVSSLNEHIIQALERPRDHVEGELAASTLMFEQNSEAADEAADDHVPPVRLMPEVLREAEEETECCNVDRQE